MRKLIWGLVVLSLVAIACGGGGDSSSESSDGAGQLPLLTSQSVESGRLVDVEGVGPLFDMLGAAVDVSTESVVVTFEPSGGRLPLGNGASIEVESGAFTESTELAVTVAEPSLDEFAENPPGVTFYVVSTDEDVEPASPVALEIPVPTTELAVGAFADGGWVPLAVPSGPTTRLEFDHFSDQARVTVQRSANMSPTSEAEVDEARIEAYQEAAESFRWCLSIIGMWSSATDSDVDAAIWANFAFSFCSAALVERLTPEGEFVTVACVGEQVDRGHSVLAAINNCIADQGPSDLADTPSKDSGEEADESEPSDEAPTVDEPTPLGFNGAGSITFLYDESDEARCETTIQVNVDVTLNPDGTATLGFSDWPIGGVVGDPPNTTFECYALGKPRIYSGFWFDRRAEVEAGLELPPGEEDALPIEAGFDVPNTTTGEQTGYTIVVEATDECAWSSANFVDAAFAEGGITRRFIVNFGIPEGCN